MEVPSGGRISRRDYVQALGAFQVYIEQLKAKERAPLLRKEYDAILESMKIRW